MAVELSVAKGSLKKTAVELGITPQILTRWRREQVGSPSTIPADEPWRADDYSSAGWGCDYGWRDVQQQQQPHLAQLFVLLE